MPDILGALFHPPAICRDWEYRDACHARARYAYLAARIEDMRLTHSMLTAEAEERLFKPDCTWSQLVFTDLFGPDVGIMAGLVERIQRLESNIRLYTTEARRLLMILGEAGGV